MLSHSTIGNLFLCFDTLILGFILGIGNAVLAKEKVIVDGKYYDWNVYYVDELGNSRKCYIASFAKESIGNYGEPRKPYIMITFFTANGVEEIGIYGDFEYRKNGYIIINVDGKQIKMFTKGNMAWAKNRQEDRDIIALLLNASNIVKVRSESINGKYAIDSYSLLGLARAYKRMMELCSVGD